MVPDIAGTGFTTTYAYTLATPKTTVTQCTTRTFQSDWLGRTNSVTEPERGTTSYLYTYTSTPAYPVAGLQVTRTRPRANQTGSLTTVTTAQYDTLGRVVSISYTDGVTPTKTFAYDTAAGANFTDLSQAYLKGRLSMASAPTAATAYSYDPVGRTAVYQCLPSGPCGTTAYNRKTAYTYDLGGRMTSSTDGAGVTTTYAVTAAAK